MLPSYASGQTLLQIGMEALRLIWVVQRYIQLTWKAPAALSKTVPWCIFFSHHDFSLFSSEHRARFFCDRTCQIKMPLHHRQNPELTMSHRDKFVAAAIYSMALRTSTDKTILIDLSNFYSICLFAVIHKNHMFIFLCLLIVETVCLEEGDKNQGINQFMQCNWHNSLFKVAAKLLFSCFVQV